MKISFLPGRDFLGKAAAAGAAGIFATSILTSCSGKKKLIMEIPLMPGRAPDGPVLKAGVMCMEHGISRKVKGGEARVIATCRECNDFIK